MKLGRNNCAFTLIELLVVLGLMAALTGGLGLAVRRGNPTAALKAGQATLANLLASARAEAVLLGTRMLLVVDAEPGDEEFLRRVILAAETAPGSDVWRCLDDGELLPDGVAVIPENLNLAGVSVAADAEPWPSTAVSSLRVAVAGTVIGPRGNTAGSFLRMLVPSEPSEVGCMRAEDWVFLVPALRLEHGVELSRPASARGVWLSEYGVAVCVNEASEF